MDTQRVLEANAPPCSCSAHLYLASDAHSAPMTPQNSSGWDGRMGGWKGRGKGGPGTLLHL